MMPSTGREMADPRYPGMAPARTPGRWRWALLPVAAAVAVYAFIAAAGKLGAWPVYMTYYDLLADGFRSGHLYIPAAPAKELLAQADPYDQINSNLWMWDASLYRGRYYMYWGPVPALLQALVKSALSIHGLIGDQYLVFAAFSLSALLGALAIDRIARELFDFVPRWLRAVMVFAFAFANPAPHLLASGGVYQASIGFGQAFALAGLLCALGAVYAAPIGRVDFRLPVAGLFWALAFGSRISLLPATALIGLCTAFACAWPTNSRVRTFVRATALISTPMVIGVGLLLLYNWLRFDNWLEFGTNNQLSPLKFRYSKDYWFANLYSYTLRSYISECKFPFAMAPWWLGSGVFPRGLLVPNGYLINEPVVGWLRVVPVTWLLPVVPIAVVQRLKFLFRRADGGTEACAALKAKSLTFLWLVTALCILSTVSGLVEMGLYMSTMRYLADVTNGLVLLAALGSFSLYSWARAWRGRVAAALAACIPALATMIFGLLLGYQGYTGHFKMFNPELHSRLVEALSVCEAPPAPDRAPSHASKRHAKH